MINRRARCPGLSQFQLQTTFMAVMVTIEEPWAAGRNGRAGSLNNPEDQRSAARSFSSGECMSQVSFAGDIRPWFRAIDVSHMKSYGMKLDDYTFMSNPDNANKVLATLSPNDGGPPSMPPGGPYWTTDRLALFAQWQTDGYQA
jgi:hypothetical protein